MSTSKKLLKFLIVLDKSDLLYFPGEILSGRVIFEMDEDMPVLGLFFHVVGQGMIKFNHRRDWVTDEENYIDFKLRLLGEPGDDSVMLSEGVHSFPFELTLPAELPSTFLGRHGWVQYYCKAALREPDGLTHKNQQVFLVMNPIDLNVESEVLLQPFHCEIEHHLGLTCITSGAVKCQVSLDRGGYVPGEAIIIEAHITNFSRVTIKSTAAILTETIQYVTKKKVTKVESRELCSVGKGKIHHGESQVWQDVRLSIPALPPTNLRGCHIIRIQHDVFFVVTPSNIEKPIRLQLPILLATYPYQGEDDDIILEDEEQAQ